jgi:hypothetical protein
VRRQNGKMEFCLEADHKNTYIFCMKFYLWCKLKRRKEVMWILIHYKVDQDSSVGVTTLYELDDPGIESGAYFGGHLV